MVAGAKAVADFPGNDSPHRPESLHKFRQQCSPGRCDELVRFVALRQRDAPFSQDSQRSRGRDRKPPMRAIEPAVPLDHRAREHARFSQHFEADASPDDVNERVKSADLVKSHLFRRHSVNFPFRDSEPLEHRHRFSVWAAARAAQPNKVVPKY